MEYYLGKDYIYSGLEICGRLYRGLELVCLEIQTHANNSFDKNFMEQCMWLIQLAQKPCQTSEELNQAVNILEDRFGYPFENGIWTLKGVTDLLSQLK